jgi:chromosome segregation ATPase
MTDKLNETLGKIQKEIEQHTDRMEKICVDLVASYRDTLDDIRICPPITNEKKSKKEKEKIMLESLHRNYPELGSLLDDYDEYLGAIEFKVEDFQDRLETIQERLEEIKEMQENIEEEKRTLRDELN